MGQNNLYDGNVLAYEPICGTGAAVVTLTPQKIQLVTLSTMKMILNSIKEIEKF